MPRRAPAKVFVRCTLHNSDPADYDELDSIMEGLGGEKKMRGTWIIPSTRKTNSEIKKAVRIELQVASVDADATSFVIGAIANPLVKRKESLWD